MLIIFKTKYFDQLLRQMWLVSKILSDKTFRIRFSKSFNCPQGVTVWPYFHSNLTTRSNDNVASRKEFTLNERVVHV